MARHYCICQRRDSIKIWSNNIQSLRRISSNLTSAQCLSCGQNISIKCTNTYIWNKELTYVIKLGDIFKPSVKWLISLNGIITFTILFISTGKPWMTRNELCPSQMYKSICCMWYFTVYSASACYELIEAKHWSLFTRICSLIIIMWYL